MWQYVYLACYLDLKETTSLTGLESYVAARRAVGGIDYFPIGQATMVKP